MSKKYDAIIIGAGMSGLAAGIRLAMYDKKVVILEKHLISGGLNSYYKRAKREFDVGLHAMTNFVQRGERGKPLTKLLKQLRIPYDQFQLVEQNHSKIIFPDNELKFNNNLEVLKNEINEKFPDQIDGFIKLLHKIENFDEVNLDNEFLPSKEVIKNYITNETLLEMIMCPLLIYGSAWENDMDFSQFVIMFKSIFLEGFSRPKGGVKTIINLLLEKFESLGGELRFKSPVTNIVTKNNQVIGVEVKGDEFLETSRVISSMGLPETLNTVDSKVSTVARTGAMSFTESILITDKKPIESSFDTTIIFYNDNPVYNYKMSEGLYDKTSAVVCFPNNFKHDDYDEGIVRVTNIANHSLWKELEKKEYLEKKNDVFKDSVNLMNKLIPNYNANVVFKDVFSPTTITRYTGHFGGAVYGSPDKARNGKTQIEGLNICGTDQGFLGIVGSMLSGISMANLYGLMD